MIHRIALLLAVSCQLITVSAQDLGSVKGHKAFTMHGSISSGASFYSSNEAYKTRDPFAWNLAGSLSPTFYGFTLPFSFVITQYSKSYTSPFTQFGISPTYKWITVHLGYRTISFSPLVFDGQSFLGAGIELRPKGFYFGAFYGRLNKAITEDSTFGHNLQPQYARRGFGMKIGVGSINNNVSLQVFHARDDSGSIRRLDTTQTTILPMQNSVVGAGWHLRFFRKLTFTGNVAASLLDRDLSYAQIDSIGYIKIPGIIRKLAPVNYSSVLGYSGQGQLLLVLNHFNGGAGYRRIQPDFRSLGVPYALDDIEMVSANAGTDLVRGRLTVNGSFNSQHNNLGHMLSSELKTQTGNLNVNAFVSRHLNVGVNLMAVKLYQADGLLKPGDSARMNQLMLNANLSPTLTFAGPLHQHTLNLNVNYTDLDDHNPATAVQTGCKSFASSLAWSLFFTQHFWGINTNILYNNYQQSSGTYQSIGFNAGLSAQLLDLHQLALQGSVGYFVNHDTRSSAGNNTTFSFNGSYGLSRHHALSLYASYVITPPVDLNPLNEVNHVPFAVNSKNLEGGVSYSYHF